MAKEIGALKKKSGGRKTGKKKVAKKFAKKSVKRAAPAKTAKKTVKKGVKKAAKKAAPKKSVVKISPPAQPAAYWLYCIDNGEHFFENAPKTIFCEKCGCVVDDSWIPDSFKMRKKADFSAKYDRRFIASARFKEYIEELNFDVEFLSLNRGGTFFLMNPRSVIAFDAAQKEDYCDSCGQYHDQVVPIPTFDEPVLKRGIY